MNVQVMLHTNQDNNVVTGVEPTFLRIFRMISGRMTPRSVGLNDFRQIKKLIGQTKTLFFLLTLVVKGSVPLFGSLMVIVPYLSECTVQQTIVFGIPNALHFILSCYYCGINFYQFAYFYIICSYLKIKITNINNDIKYQIAHRDSSMIIKKIRALNDIYIEIDDYNRTYFSKFLLSFWVSLGSVFVLLLFEAIFPIVDLVYKVIFTYISGLFAFCIALVIFTPSSLNTEANKSYAILNSFLSRNYQTDYFKKIASISTKFKVSQLTMIHTNVIDVIQVNTIIAQVSSMNIGFTCGHLFTINYFHSYEVRLTLTTIDSTIDSTMCSNSS